MARLILLMVLVGGVVGGIYYLMNYETDVRRSDKGDLEAVTITPRSDDGQAGASGGGSDQPGVTGGRSRIRIATFNVSGLNRHKLANRRINEILVDVIAQFDLLAVQNVHAENQGVLAGLIEQLNAKGRKYNYATGPIIGEDTAGPYSAFLFDQQAVVIDRSTVRFVEDSDGLFRHRPLVAQFRAVGPDPGQAFTFKLINVHVDPIRAMVEVDLLDDVYRAVRNDGGQEDDAILLGDFGTHQANLTRWDGLPDVISLISRTPTTLRATLPVDNIFIDHRATTEFTGVADVLDLMRKYELSMRATVQISEHMPAWAEFSTYEGGQAGHVADHPTRTTR